MRQAEAWKGAFGDDYTDRNQCDATAIARREAMWGGIVNAMGLEGRLGSVLEVGANVGVNLAALEWLRPAHFIALEPNAKAREILTASGLADEVLSGTADSIPLPDESVDLAFTCGVLIHIPPDQLGQACDEIYRVSRRYIACVEYFSAEPEEKTYRGEEGLLFKRDFGSFWMDRHPDLQLLGYGFCWKRATGLDNSTWWLFKK